MAGVRKTQEQFSADRQGWRECKYRTCRSPFRATVDLKGDLQLPWMAEVPEMQERFSGRGKVRLMRLRDFPIMPGRLCDSVPPAGGRTYSENMGS